MPQISFCVGMGAALAKESCVMVPMTVEMVVMRALHKTAVSSPLQSHINPSGTYLIWKSFPEVYVQLQRVGKSGC